MKKISGDKYLNFLIQNYRDIRALLEVYESAKERINHYVDKEVEKAIEELKHSYFAKKGIEYGGNSGNNIRWHDDHYELEDDSEKGKGPYFVFELGIVTLEWIESETPWDPSSAPSLSLYIDISLIKKKDQDAFLKKYNNLRTASEKKLQKQGFSVWEADPGSLALVSYPLQKEITMENLANREQFRKGIQLAVKKFTDALLPIVRKGPKA
jgi:virulence-associated protein VapD